ncbi:hypothetical protein [Alkalicoccus chagannorensis]|uniref:hypothetical protein n=1 Tax=Alkalicoccus chagannorensis TaxID=427072 RepID=UPI00041FE3BF|nr:hypothetical protein [Alkalicoccus chagannorensis]
MAGWAVRMFAKWKIPQFPIEKADTLLQAVRERPAFVEMKQIPGTAGSPFSRYIFYDQERDMALLFRYPLSSVAHVYLLIRGRHGRFDPFDTIKVVTIELDPLYQGDNRVTFHQRGWWNKYVNDLFRYLLHTAADEHVPEDLQTFATLEQQAPSEENDLLPMFRGGPLKEESP